jgi:hypothetical protein
MELIDVHFLRISFTSFLLRSNILTAPSSQTTSMYVLPLIWDTKFQIQTNTVQSKVKLSLHVIN